MLLRAISGCINSDVFAVVLLLFFLVVVVVVVVFVVVVVVVVAVVVVVVAAAVVAPHLCPRLRLCSYPCPCLRSDLDPGELDDRGHAIQQHCHSTHPPPQLSLLRLAHFSQQ